MTDALTARLEEWGRAMRWYRGSGRACFSVEGQYRPEGGIEAMEARRAPKPLPPGMDDAWIVEWAWKTLCPPETFKYAMLLRYHYVSKWEPARIVRTIAAAGHWRIRDYQATLGMAHALIAEALERREDQNRYRLRRIVKRLLAIVVEPCYKGARSNNSTSATA